MDQEAGGREPRYDGEDVSPVGVPGADARAGSLTRAQDQRSRAEGMVFYWTSG